MKKITCVTPTGDRPKVFEITRDHMLRQTIQPDQWIIVDDGREPLPEELRQGADYIRREPSASDGCSLSLNLKTALPYITGDIILVVEDDDYYSELYVETIHTYLAAYSLVGEGCARYYHVPAGRYVRLQNKSHASLAQTGFHKSLLPLFEKILSARKFFVDIRLWDEARDQMFLFFDLQDKFRLHCSLKGLPGRPGIGIGHDKNLRGYVQDKNYTILKKWVGEENASKYIQCCKEEGLINGENNSK